MSALFSRWPVYDRVIVNLLDGTAIDGVLYAKRGRLLVLTDARLMQTGAEPMPMDGRIYVERDHVSFIQAALPKGG